MSRFPNAVDACVIPGWLGPKGEPGVWVAGSDGGVGAYPVGAGAPFHNSIPGIGVHLNAPIRCIVPHDSGGYWLVGQDGAVFAFGNAPGIGWPPSFTYDQFFSQYQAGDRAIVNAEPFAGGLVLLADDGAFYELGTPK